MLAYKIECLIHPVIKKGWHNGRLLENIELFKSDSIRHGHTYLKINVVFGVSEKCEIKDNILQCPYLLVFGPVFLRFRQTSLGLFFPWQPGKWDSGAHWQQLTHTATWTIKALLRNRRSQWKFCELSFKNLSSHTAKSQ